MSTETNDALTIRHAPDDVPGLRDCWSAAEGVAAYCCGSYHDYMTLGGDRQRIAVSHAAARPDLMLPFTVETWWHKFTVGERRLGRLSARALRLANPWTVEGGQPAEIARLMRYALMEERVDLLALGEIPEASTLRAALKELSWPARPMQIGRKESLRWLIDLPESFEAYLGHFTSKSRKNLLWQMRKLEKDFDVRFEIITQSADLQRFLEEGERISRQTYQWNVGQQLRNDAKTQERCRQLAQQGRLRCYLLVLDGTARAFAYGTIEGKIFNYETPGFDPDFAKHSIGTTILLMVLRDLIENTPCETFDFGIGGDETGYKSRFGNRKIICNSYYVTNATRPRAFLILSLQKFLTGAKNIAARIIPEGEMRNRLKRRLRKYGA